MRIMDEEQMLEVVEAQPAQRLELARRLAPLCGGHPAPWLAAGVKSGQFKICTVRKAGRDIAVFWWWWSPANKSFIAAAGASLDNTRDVLDDLFTAMESLAKYHGAQTIEFQTARRGLAKKIVQKGYTAEAVKFTKIL